MTSKATDTAKPRTIPRSLIPHGWIQDPTELAIASKIFPHDEYDIPGNGPPQALFRRHADPPLFIVEVKSFEGQSNGRFYLWHPQVKKVDEVLEPSTLEEIVSLLGKKSEHSHKLNTRAVETRSAAERRSLLHAQTAKMKQLQEEYPFPLPRGWTAKPDRLSMVIEGFPRADYGVPESVLVRPVLVDGGQIGGCPGVIVEMEGFEKYKGQQYYYWNRLSDDVFRIVQPQKLEDIVAAFTQDKEGPEELVLEELEMVEDD